MNHALKGRKNSDIAIFFLIGRGVERNSKKVRRFPFTPPKCSLIQKRSMEHEKININPASPPPHRLNDD